ncbi:MAG TPA: TolC family protein [Candidatus Limnocylindrales bacterium]|nr:TolC family protein [Candidatus Limnocylindrales bacterium]
MRTFGVLVLALSVTLAPVAPAFGQSPQQQGQNPPPNTGQTQGQPPTPPQPKKTSDQGEREYLHGNRAFPDLLGPYRPIHIAAPNFANTSLLQQMIKDGKLMISMQDAITLALENSIDIDVVRYNPWIADAQILSAESSNGTNLSFDPRLILNGGGGTSTSPVSNPFTTGVGSGISSFTSHNASGNITYNQGFETGTNLTITQNNSRLSNSATASSFNPQISSTMSVSVTQQLLNGFGILPNVRFIRIAQNTQKFQDLAFQQQVITTVTAVQNDYWQLVFAIQNIAVQQQSVDSAQTLVNADKKQVEIGTMAPLDVVTAEASLAAAQTALVNANTNKRQQELILLAAMTRDPIAATQLNFEVVPTDTTYIPDQVENMPLDQAVREALSNRPDYKQSIVNLKSDDITVRANRNALLPTLSVTGNYTWSSLAGVKINSGSVLPGQFVANLNNPIVGANGVPIPGEFTSSPVIAPPATPTTSTGLGDALDQIFTNQFPGYNAQFTFTVPILNRAAQGTSIQSILLQRQDQTKLQQQQNAIAVAIRNAQIQLEQSRAALASAIKAKDFQQTAYDDENKKLTLGASTVFAVTQQLALLSSAAGQEVLARVNLVIAKVNFDNVMGRTLQVNNITVADAHKPANPLLNRDTLIPGTHADGSIITDNPQE